MKPALILLLLTVTCLAQTNRVFPILKNAHGEQVMTNAEFRVLSGRKVFFKNESGYKSFDAIDLDSGVLKELNIDPQLAITKQNKDEESKRAAIASAQKQQAEYLKKRALGELVITWDEFPNVSMRKCEATNSTKQTISVRVVFSCYDYDGKKAGEAHCYIDNLKPNQAGKCSPYRLAGSEIRVDKVEWRVGAVGKWHDVTARGVKVIKTELIGDPFEFKFPQKVYRVFPSEDELEGSVSKPEK